MKFDLFNYKKLLLEIQATYNKYKLNPDDNYCMIIYIVY